MVSKVFVDTDVIVDHLTDREPFANYSSLVFELHEQREVRIHISALSVSNIYRIYHSCGHSQCSICQSIKRAQWQDRLRKKLFAVPYIHTVFTIPHEMNKIARENSNEVYNILMRSSWMTVKQLTKDSNNVGALPGMVSVLHTY